MKKKLMALLLTASLVGALAACGSKGTEEQPAAPAEEEAGTEEAGSEEAEPEAAGEDSDIVVAGIVYLDDQFQNLITQGYKDAAAEAGVTIMTENTNNDQTKETELLNTYMTQKVDGVAISPLNADASVKTLKEAIDAGMKVALTDCTMDDVSFAIGAWTSDGYTNGNLAGKEAATFIKEKHGDDTVKVAIVQFASLLPDQSKNRVDGYLAGLEEGGVKYEVVADQDAWMQDTALETAGGIITANPDLDVIITVNDGGTIGSTQAVVAAGKEDQIMVFGHDGSDQISSMVLDDASPLKAVVAQDPYMMGYTAMSTLISTIKGETEAPAEGTVEYIDGIVLTSNDKDAVNAWRVDQGFEEIK